MELQTGEIPVEISVNDLRLRIWEIMGPWNWGVMMSSMWVFQVCSFTCRFRNSNFNLKVEELLTFYCHKYTPTNPNDILSVHPQGEVAECSAQYVTASK